MRTLLVIYFLLSCLAIISSGMVISVLLRKGNFKSCFTLLLLWLHISLVSEMITLFPYAFSYNTSLCTAAQFFHCYFGLMNTIIVLLLVEAHRSSLLGDPFGSRRWIHRYGKLLILGLPCITTIPYMMNNQRWIDLSNDDTGWCTLPVAGPLGLEIGVFYFWIWLCLISSVLIMLYTGYVVYRSDHILARRFYSTIGITVIIALVSWAPRSLERSPDTAIRQSHFLHHILSLLPVAISGICFGVLFFVCEKPTLALLKELYHGTSGAITGETSSRINRGKTTNDQSFDQSLRMTFTWEDLDLQNWELEDEENNAADIKNGSNSNNIINTMHRERYDADTASGIEFESSKAEAEKPAATKTNTSSATISETVV